VVAVFLPRNTDLKQVCSFSSCPCPCPFPCPLRNGRATPGSGQHGYVCS